MSINNLSWQQVENPSKTKFKQLYLNKYRAKLGLLSNHKEQLPKSVFRQINSLVTKTQKYFNQRIGSSNQTRNDKSQNNTRQLKGIIIQFYSNILTAQLLNKISQKQLEQEYFCQFPEIIQKKSKKKKRSKTEYQNNQYGKLQKTFARTAYLIVI